MCEVLQLRVEQREILTQRLIQPPQFLHRPRQLLRPRQTPRDPAQHLLQHFKLLIRTQPVIGNHVRRDLRQAFGQLPLIRQHPVHVTGELLQRLIGVQRPVPRQTMVEKHVEDDPGITPPGRGETPEGDVHQRVAIGEHINAPMQLNRRFNRRRKLPLQASFDEIAIQTAE